MDSMKELKNKVREYVKSEGHQLVFAEGGKEVKFIGTGYGNIKVRYSSRMIEIKEKTLYLYGLGTKHPTIYLSDIVMAAAFLLEYWVEYCQLNGLDKIVFTCPKERHQKALQLLGFRFHHNELALEEVKSYPRVSWVINEFKRIFRKIDESTELFEWYSPNSYDDAYYGQFFKWQGYEGTVGMKVVNHQLFLTTETLKLEGRRVEIPPVPITEPELLEEKVNELLQTIQEEMGLVHLFYPPCEYLTQLIEFTTFGSYSKYAQTIMSDLVASGLDNKETELTCKRLVDNLKQWSRNNSKLYTVPAEAKGIVYQPEFFKGGAWIKLFDYYMVFGNDEYVLTTSPSEIKEFYQNLVEKEVNNILQTF